MYKLLGIAEAEATDVATADHIDITEVIEATEAIVGVTDMDTVDHIMAIIEDTDTRAIINTTTVDILMVVTVDTNKWILNLDLASLS